MQESAPPSAQAVNGARRALGDRHLALIGAMGAGKSTVGAQLAAALQRPFVDVDAEVVRAEGRSIAAIFAQDGEPAFRAAEQAALAAALAGPPAVLACGGGTAIDPRNRTGLAAAARTICLTAPTMVLAARVAGDPGRPLARDSQALEILVTERRAVVAEAADLVVDASEGEPAEICERVLCCLAAGPSWRRESAVIGGAAEGAGGLVCRLLAGAGVRAAALPALAALGSSRVAVVSDATVWPLHAAAIANGLADLGCRVERHSLVGDEAHKTLADWVELVTALTRGGADRDLLVVAVGGGVVCDMAGFAAATALRGVRHALLPTTLLAQVDAAIGGKTGVDTVDGKNLVGAFHQPRLVVCDSDWLATLPPRELAAGMAEVVKTALVADAGLWQLLQQVAGPAASLSSETLGTIVARCAAAKLDVVRRDPHERGLRRALNFGHTLGHALEREAGFGVWLHGEAVAIGSRLALDVGVALGLTPEPLRDAALLLLRTLGLPTELPSAFADAAGQQRLLAALAHDKKAVGDGVRFVVVCEPGTHVERRLTAREIGGLLGWSV